jgi:hypothetical protein
MTPALNTNLNTLLNAKNIVSITDPYGSTETNNGGWTRNLPIYNSLPLDSTPVTILLYGNNNTLPLYGMYNTIFNNKYLKFTATSTVTRLSITSTDTFGFEVYNKGVSVKSIYNQRTSGSTFGPYVYNVTTTVGQEYIIQIYSDQSVVFANSLITLTFAATPI